MIYIDILPESLRVTTLGISSVPFPLLRFRDSLKICNNGDVKHKLYLDFRCYVGLVFSLCTVSHVLSQDYVIIIFCSMHCETFYRFLVSSFSSFFSSDDRSVLAGHVYSALTEEMPAGAGRAITFGIRDLGCVVNLGKLSGRDNIRNERVYL